MNDTTRYLKNMNYYFTERDWNRVVGYGSVPEERKLENMKISEISTDLLARYKTKAAADASAADKAGDYERGNKRFASITRATNKQFANDAKERESNVNSMTLPEFWDLLNKHDWLYQMSDDQRSYQKGKQEREELERYASLSPEHKELFMAFATWGQRMMPGQNPSAEKPERPE